jgi:hypothetical protein
MDARPLARRMPRRVQPSDGRGQLVTEGVNLMVERTNGFRHLLRWCGCSGASVEREPFHQRELERRRRLNPMGGRDRSSPRPGGSERLRDLWWRRQRRIRHGMQNRRIELRVAVRRQLLVVIISTVRGHDLVRVDARVAPDVGNTVISRRFNAEEPLLLVSHGAVSGDTMHAQHH